MNIQDRRVRDAYAGSSGWVEPASIAEAERMLADLHDAMVAGQSTDDLGSEAANQAMWDHLLAMQRRADRLREWVAEQRAR